MFTITSPDGTSADGLLIPPGAVAVQDGPAVEEVLFLRDEMANLAWAVERERAGSERRGPRPRARARRPHARSAPGPVAAARSSTTCCRPALPARWIPYLPRTQRLPRDRARPGRDARRRPAQPSAPLGRLLNDRRRRQVLKDAEIPREGVVVRRQPSMTRRADGTYVRWTTRRVGVGRGEGSSRLAFDTAQPRR